MSKGGSRDNQHLSLTPNSHCRYQPSLNCLTSLHVWWYVLKKKHIFIQASCSFSVSVGITSWGLPRRRRQTSVQQSPAGGSERRPHRWERRAALLSSEHKQKKSYNSTPKKKKMCTYIYIILMKIKNRKKGIKTENWVHRRHLASTWDKAHPSLFSLWLFRVTSSNPSCHWPLQVTSGTVTWADVRKLKDLNWPRPGLELEWPKVCLCTHPCPWLSQCSVCACVCDDLIDQRNEQGQANKN